MDGVFISWSAVTNARLNTTHSAPVIITKDSDPEIQFDVFERLNTNTMPLNAQELRNCIYRGKLNDLLAELTEFEPWLRILGTRQPDRRLRDEELILRFFAFYIDGLENYRTPQKHWLNDVAKRGRSFSDDHLERLGSIWKVTIENCLIVFAPQECFRRLDQQKRRRVINRALMDLVMTTMADRPPAAAQKAATQFRDCFVALLHDDEFQDVISRAIDHKSRTLRRFEMWNRRLVEQVF